ncbi:23S rRNA (uracil(1939)-C(5))-methyltransferase RlmD [filamentous cyanobacterium CCP5]|nr:23S rRNA (uracil(1939)-C(5))-methyltransferase RlmD [filamentous cyanobacterium CCP5]
MTETTANFPESVSTDFNAGDAESQWRQGETLELTVDDLTSSGDGLGRWEGRVVFVPDTVPGDRVRTRLLQVKPAFAKAKLLAVLKPSPQRVRPPCIVADKCGGCQWQPVAYEAQAAAKQQQVQDALSRIGEIDAQVSPIIPADPPLGYRNKATYPLSLSQPKEGQEPRVRAGYYRKGSHRLVNLNQCPVQDDRLDPFLARIKQDIQRRGWSIYDEKSHRGHLRHLALRIGRRTGEVLLTLVATVDQLVDLEHQAAAWMAEYDALVGVCLNHNPARTNAIFGEDTLLVEGRSYLMEQFAGLEFRVHPTTFFQVNTEQAERLVAEILTELDLKGTETIIDAYCGIGTLTLPLAQKASRCIGLEVQKEAVKQGQANAQLNGIENAEFRVGEVSDWLPKLELELDATPDVVVLDPPRKGCDRPILDALLEMHPARIVYMSCNAATLARDLKILATGGYRVTRVQPADFFPQTPHVECVAFLVA